MCFRINPSYQLPNFIPLAGQPVLELVTPRKPKQAELQPSGRYQKGDTVLNGAFWGNYLWILTKSSGRVGSRSCL